MTYPRYIRTAVRAAIQVLAVPENIVKIVRNYGETFVRLHAGRRTAATLALEAGITTKVVSGQLGHSTTRSTSGGRSNGTHPRRTPGPRSTGHGRLARTLP